MYSQCTETCSALEWNKPLNVFCSISSFQWDDSGFFFLNCDILFSISIKVSNPYTPYIFHWVKIRRHMWLWNHMHPIIPEEFQSVLYHGDASIVLLKYPERHSNRHSKKQQVIFSYILVGQCIHLARCKYNIDSTTISKCRANQDWISPLMPFWKYFR